MTTASGAASDRRGEIVSLIKRLHSGSLDDVSGMYRALAALLVDAILAEDHGALIAGQEHLQTLYADQFGDQHPDLDGTRLGGTGALLDAASWALRRLTPSSTLRALDNDPIQRRLLEAVDEIPGMTSQQVADRLGIESERVAAIAGPVLRGGLIRARNAGPDTFWNISPRGRSALTVPLRLSADRRALEDMAQQVLEPRWSNTAVAGRGPRRRPVTAEVLAALIAADGPLSEEDLVTATHYRAPHVRLATQVLSSRDFIVRMGDDNGETARYAPNGSGWCAIGMHVRPEQVIGVVTDLRGAPVRSLTRALTRHDPDTVVQQIAEVVHELRTNDTPGLIPDGLVGLGVELGGHIDGRTGRVMLSPNLEWDKPVELAQRVSAQVHLPTVVENDMTALATYQELFGSLGSDTRNYAVIIVGDGVGAGFVVDGDVIRGGTGMAGEIGHLLYKPDGRDCHCGKRGCVEAYTALPAISERVEELTGLRVSGVEEVFERVAGGDAACKQVVADAGQALGRAIATVENLINPAEILLLVPRGLAAARSRAAGAASAAQVFETSLRSEEKMHAFSSGALGRKLRIEYVADLDTHGALGAAAAVLRRFVEQPLGWRPVPAAVGTAPEAHRALREHRSESTSSTTERASGDLLGLVSEAYAAVA